MAQGTRGLGETRALFVCAPSMGAILEVEVFL